MTWLLSRKELSQGAKLVYMALASFQAEDGRACSTQEALSKAIGGVCVRQCRRYLQELEAVGLIVNESAGRVNCYGLPEHQWQTEHRTPESAIAEEHRTPESGIDEINSGHQSPVSKTVEPKKPRKRTPESAIAEEHRTPESGIDGHQKRKGSNGLPLNNPLPLTPKEINHLSRGRARKTAETGFPEFDDFPVEVAWHELYDVEPTLRAAALAILSVPKFAKNGIPNRESLSKVIATALTEAPSASLVVNEFETFVAWHSKKRKNGTDGVASLRNWLSNCYPRWVLASVRANQRGNSSKHSKVPELTDEDIRAFIQA